MRNIANIKTVQTDAPKKEYYQNTNRTTEWTANYNTSINGVHNITGLLGYSYQDFEYEQFSAENKNFLTDVFGTNNLEAGGYLKDGKAEMKSKKETSKLIAFFAAPTIITTVNTWPAPLSAVKVPRSSERTTNGLGSPLSAQAG